ncbi:IS110 family transposase [Streptomyces sp. NBC_01431]|uniref:IS110 family transposase n=1 Tax=Streptomyces sp. NBC_01431 TaxID=2903863 RepID=UPI002E379717|nr:transposase [Streptomyces sp. NBC_01431]
MDPEEVVLGIDTHRDAHVAAAVSTAGQVLAARSFPATAAGYRQLVQWVGELGVVRRAGVEGAGSYGAALTRYLLSRGILVYEAPGPGRAARRRHGKSDRRDAEADARAVLSGRARSCRKAGNGPIEIARMYKTARDSAVKASTQATNQLKTILVTADPALREELMSLKRRALIRACARLSEDDGAADPVLQATRFTLCTLAQRIEQILVQAQGLQQRLSALIERHYPELLDAIEVGPEAPPFS